MFNYKSQYCEETYVIQELSIRLYDYSLNQSLLKTLLKKRNKKPGMNTSYAVIHSRFLVVIYTSIFLEIYPSSSFSTFRTKSKRSHMVHSQKSCSGKTSCNSGVKNFSAP